MYVKIVKVIAEIVQIVLLPVVTIFFKVNLLSAIVKEKVAKEICLHFSLVEQK